MSTDPRFARLHTDPRFVRPKAAKNKIVVDERFKSLFDGDEGASKGKKERKVDKYGRKLEKEAGTNELKRYYRMEEKPEEVEEEEDEDEEESGSEEDGSESEEEAGEGEAKEGKAFVDYARGEGLVESSDEEGSIPGAEEDEDDDSDSDSDSEGSVTLGPSTLRRRPKARSPSHSPEIDLSETEPTTTAFPDSDASEEEEELSDEDDKAADPTTRLAVVNMDWDHIRAVDLYRVLASSLSATAPSSVPISTKPKAKLVPKKKFDDDGNEVPGSYQPPSKLTIAKGRLLNLRIYPSQFGKERMEKEEREGPPTEVFAAAARADSDDEDDEGVMVLGRAKKSSRRKRGESSDEESDEEITERDVVREQVDEGGEDYDGEALRKYQLERLRYYYAVATFDSATAAQHVFNEINNTEFERTANVFDLQYVPEDTSFEGDAIHDEATESSIAAAGTSYTGIDFVTDALRHSKVKLTWDADDPHRKSKMQAYLASATDLKGKGKKDMNDDDIRAYLASSSEDEDEPVEDEPEDDFFEPAEGSKSKGKGKKSAPKDKRDKLRSLFGLDGDDGMEENAWDGGKAGTGKGASNDGGMQITFAPALSSKKGKKSKKGGFGDEDEESDEEIGGKGGMEETAIETYKRKEKERRERKRLERKARKNGVELPPVGEEGPEFGGEDVGPGGFDDDFFADDGGDPFAAFDDGREVDSGDEIGLPKRKSGKKGVKAGHAAVVEEPPKKLNKRQRRELKQAEEAANKLAQAELELLVASDDDNDGAKHFDMRHILKAEKNAGKKGRKGKKGAAEEPVVKDSFEIDLKDDRFKSLHEDYDFAIDPTNPRFQKTRNMDALLTEGRKRRQKGHDARAPVGAPVSAGVKRAKAAVDDQESLQRLVESVKRKAGDAGGRGKRAKVGEE